MHEVFIVKQSAATVLGRDLRETWERLIEGRSAFENGPAVLRAPAAASEVGAERVLALADAVLEALAPVPAEACLIWTGIKGGAAFIEADQTGAPLWLAEHYREWAGKRLGLAGRGFEVNAACASSTVASAIAALKIASGEIGCAVVCGADAVSDFVIRGFSALKALSPTRCRPFDTARDGMCLGDGAVALLLADERTAAAHGLTPLAKIAGWGVANDANHITGPSPDGAGLVRAIDAALKTAGLRPEAVEAFCAHGTGTVFNDGMELAALDAVFGPRTFPVFSIKGALGHTLGAAGGIDAAVCVEALRARKVPPTAGLENIEPRATGRVSGRVQACAGRNILTSNSGFGGINAALLLTAV